MNFINQWNISLNFAFYLYLLISISDKNIKFSAVGTTVNHPSSLKVNVSLIYVCHQ